LVTDGEARGEKKAKTEIALKLLEAGVEIDQVATFTGLSEVVVM
jgi:hypothetical protein